MQQHILRDREWILKEGLFSHTYPNKTSVELSAHAYEAIPGQRVNTDKARVEWWKDLMNNNGILIKVSTKNLQINIG